VKPAETAVARQWLGEPDVTAATLAYATIEELLEVVFSMPSAATASHTTKKAAAKRNCFMCCPYRGYIIRTLRARIWDSKIWSWVHWGSHPRMTALASKSKVKFSLYRPWRPLGLREVEPPTFSDIRLVDDGKIVSPTRRPLFAPLKISGIISVRGWVDPRAIVWVEGLGELKKPPHTGLEPVTSQLVA
jgi:hypothetical protein